VRSPSSSARLRWGEKPLLLSPPKAGGGGLPTLHPPPGGGGGQSGEWEMEVGNMVEGESNNDGRGGEMEGIGS